MDRLRNEDIRNELNIYELNKKNYRRCWKEHVDKINENRLPSNAINFRCTGRRNVGRSRKILENFRIS